MKKMMTLVLALVFVLGFASAAFAMGPDGDVTNVGFVLTNFVMSDQMLSPLAMPNWTGALNANKAIAEGQPVWFVASYVQNKFVADDSRNFMSSATASPTRTTVFTSKDNTVNWAYSSSYMNFVYINKLEVLGGQVGAVAPAKINAEENKLEVTMVAGASNTDARPSNAQVMRLEVPIGTDSSANYYLQVMGFTKACTEAQGTVYAKTPIDVAEFSAVTSAILFTSAKLTGFTPVAGSMIQIYDENNNVKYKVVRFQIVSAAALTWQNLGAADNDYLYGVYNSDDEPIVGFLSSNSTYRGLVVATGTVAEPVQWSSDDGGKWVFTNGANGVKAISDADLKAVMAFFGFSFGTTYPVLSRHFEARAGYWMVKEAKYNVAAAVIVGDDPVTDIVPKTGDVASSMGLIMIAIALSGLAAVGFVVSKRVHN